MASGDIVIEAKRRKLFDYAAKFGLRRDERIELAEMILRRDIMSWSDLDERQIDQLLDAFEAAAFVFYLINQRR